MSIVEEKKALRMAVEADERMLSIESRRNSDKGITENIISLPEYKQAQTIFCYAGTEREINTDDILLHTLKSGKRLCVPLCISKGVMVFKEILSLEDLVSGTYGIREPKDYKKTVNLTEADLVIVPCVSCNSKGQRLGHGGGFYDRFLEEYEGSAVMLCRSALMRDNIPTESHDRTFGIVVTDNEIFRNA